MHSIDHTTLPHLIPLIEDAQALGTPLRGILLCFSHLPRLPFSLEEMAAKAVQTARQTLPTTELAAYCSQDGDILLLAATLGKTDAETILQSIASLAEQPLKPYWADYFYVATRASGLISWLESKATMLRQQPSREIILPLMEPEVWQCMRSNRSRAVVLLVSPSLPQQQALENAFHHDADVHWVQDSQHIMAYYRSYVPDMVLLDMALPEESAEKTLRHLLSKDSAAYVLMLGSEAQREAMATCLQHGAAGFLLPPYQTEKLMFYLAESRTHHQQAAL